MNITDLLPEVFTECNGVPRDMALNALRHTSREFCNRSEAWQELLDDIDIISGFQTYEIDVPADSELVRVLSFLYNDLSVASFTKTQMDVLDPAWRNRTGSSVECVIVDRGTVTIVPEPSANFTYPLKIRASLRPTMTAATIPDVLGEWRDGLVAGAVYRLKAQSGKPWSDPDSAALFYARFKNDLFRARHAVHVEAASQPYSMETMA